MAKCGSVTLVTCCVLVLLGTAYCGRDWGVRTRATCELTGKISGTIILEEREQDLLIKGYVAHLPLGPHAIHVHTHGLTGNDCKDAGGHYNPHNVSHGAPYDSERHVGDWGNLDVNRDPYRLAITDHVAKLTGPHSIVGRAIVFHAGADDLGRGDSPSSKLNGNAGGRLGCCVISTS